MADIPDETAAIVLANAGRRCCICRRFKPLRLQVHHIIEKGSGGTNDLDNLIALCLTCHTDVHSRVPFTRRFTSAELQLHRNALYRSVAENRLPPDEVEPLLRTTVGVPIAIDEGPALIPEAVNLLVALANGDGVMLQPTAIFNARTVHDRARATQQAAFDELCKRGLLRFQSGSMYTLTLEGFNAADAYIALMNQPGTNSIA